MVAQPSMLSAVSSARKRTRLGPVGAPGPPLDGSGQRRPGLSTDGRPFSPFSDGHTTPRGRREESRRHQRPRVAFRPAASRRAAVIPRENRPPFVEGRAVLQLWLFSVSAAPRRFPRSADLDARGLVSGTPPLQPWKIERWTPRSWNHPKGRIGGPRRRLNLVSEAPTGPPLLGRDNPRRSRDTAHPVTRRGGRFLLTGTVPRDE